VRGPGCGRGEVGVGEVLHSLGRARGHSPGRQCPLHGSRVRVEAEWLRGIPGRVAMRAMVSTSRSRRCPRSRREIRSWSSPSSSPSTPSQLVDVDDLEHFASADRCLLTASASGYAPVTLGH
jgi:hypothetical protein